MGRVGWLVGVVGWSVVYRKDLDKLMKRKREITRGGDGVDLYVVNKDFFYSGFVLLGICIAEWKPKRSLRWVGFLQ